MANTVSTREAAIQRIVALLQQVDVEGVAFPHVFRHEPVFIPEARCVAVVYRGDGEADGYPRMTMSHQMVALRFDIIVSWPWGSYDVGYLDDIEKELVDVDRAIQAAINSDRDLDGNVSDVQTYSSDTGYMTSQTDNGAVYVGRWLKVPITVALLDAEAISL